MPSTSRVHTISAFEEIQKHARQLLSNLTNEIRSKEADLRQLKEAESTLSRLTGLRATSGNSSVAARGGGGKARINWSTVLQQMPKQFKAGDVCKLRGLKEKRSSEIFAAITRWIEAGSVKRKERGLYERVQPLRPRKTA